MFGAIILTAGAAGQLAQATQANGTEIVVTGERIARTRRETASSVVVVTAESIDQQAGPDRIEQLLQQVPNVQLGSGGEAPTIRGQDSTGVVRDLPAFLGGSRPRLSLQVDGRAITYYELAFGLNSIWDVDRVEVFRSPQTTTQGRNSIAGAIFVETRNPAEEWEGKVRLVAGDFATRQASVVVSGPLLDDQLAFRIAGDLRRSKTSSQITDAAVGIDPNRDDSELVRFKIVAKPQAIPGAHLNLTYVHGHSQMPQIEGVEAPFEQRRNPNATYGIFAITTDALTGKFKYVPTAVFDATATLSYGSAKVRRYAPRGLGEAQINSKDLSVEQLIGWKPSPAFQATGGLHYLRTTLHQTIDVTAQQFGIGKFDDVQHSLGLFGETTVRLTSRLTVTAGLRFQQDRQRRRGAMTGGRANLLLDYDGRFHAWLPKLSIAYDLSPSLRIGVLGQRAYNPGGVTINTARFASDTFGAEKLWDVELFARATLANGKITIAANAFHYDMTDAQRPQSIAFTLPNGTIAFPI